MRGRSSEVRGCILVLCQSMRSDTPLQEEALTETANCPLCDTAGVHLFSQQDLLCGIPGRFGQRYCADCGLYFLSPRVVESAIGAYYPESYAPYAEDRQPSFIRWAASLLGLPLRRRRIVERHIKQGRLLDVGPGNGFFLSTLDCGYWKKYAVDIACQLRGHAATEVEFIAGQFDGEKPPIGELDVITCWCVFEHFYHPAKALRNAHELLRTGGFLFLAIPDLRNIERPLFGKYWVGWDVPRHIATYSDAAMRHLVRASGFTFVEVVSHPYTGELFLLNVDFYRRARGARSELAASLLLRVLLSPAVWLLARLGLSPLKVYVVRK